MSMTEIAKLTNAGGRACNQDYADYAEAGGKAIAAVADGLGAYSDSDRASEAAVRAAIKWFSRTVKRGGEIFDGAAITELFQSAHAAVRKIKNAGGIEGCTTLSVVITDGKRLIAAHAGDTRIYFFSGGELGFYSKDHSMARLAADRGEIPYSALRRHEDQNKLTRVIGAESFARPDYKISQVHGGDDVIVCTDGFWEYVYESEMERALSSTREAAEALSKMETLLLSRAPRGNDNYTAILMRISEGGNA